MRRADSAVGVPIHEVRLTSAAIEGAHALLGDDTAVAAIAMTEVTLGIGRPDVIVVATREIAMGLRQVSGLRLHNLAEANILRAKTVEAALAEEPTRHTRRLISRLDDRGWFNLPAREPVIATSLLMEAKVKAWRDGIRQLARVRWAAHHAALVVPEQVASRIRANDVRRPRVGVISVSDDGTTNWRRRSPVTPLPFHVDAWLAELALRSLESS